MPGHAVPSVEPMQATALLLATMAGYWGAHHSTAAQRAAHLQDDPGASGGALGDQRSSARPLALPQGHRCQAPGAALRS